MYKGSTLAIVVEGLRKKKARVAVSGNQEEAILCY